MLDLRSQFVAPVLLTAAGAAIGWLSGSLPAGIVAGLLLGLLFALILGARARGKVQSALDVVARSPNRAGTEPLGSQRDPLNLLQSALTRYVEREQHRQLSEQSQHARQIQLLDQMNDGVMRVDASGTVVYSNVAAGTLLGGRNPTGRSFIAAVRDHELNQLLHQCLTAGDNAERTFDIAGEPTVVNAVFVRLTDDPPEALVVLRDITELTRLQTLRRDFVANVSHELRTPLSTIKILTETLIDLSQGRDEEQRFLEKIDAEVDSMIELVNDLMSLARLESSRGQLVLQALDPRLVIEDVRNRMRALADRSGVNLIVEINDVEGTVVADERRLGQALINLVQNALAHTQAGGEVRLAVQDLGDEIEYAVSDTGSGIPPDHVNRIWERFYKVDRSRSNPGTGLGLAIVKHIVLAHEGSVSASSEVGKGSTFVIRLPKQPAPTASDGRNLPATTTTAD